MRFHVLITAFGMCLGVLSANAAAQNTPDEKAVEEQANREIDAVMEQTAKEFKAAHPLNEPYYAYMRKDYATAIKLLRPLANQGNAKAQTAIGLMYFNGQGVTQDDLEAVKWFRKAAEQGEGKADRMLGFMYLNSRGVTQDITESMKWYRKAADEGEDVPRSLIGDTYPCAHCSPRHYDAAQQQRDDQQMKEQRQQEEMDEMHGDLVIQQMEQQQEIDALEQREHMDR